MEMTGRDIVDRALHVPLLLGKPESRRRAAAAALLRRTPGLRNAILTIDKDPDAPVTDEVWATLELALDVCSRVNDTIAKSLDDGKLDAIIGRFPDRDRPALIESLIAAASTRLDQTPTTYQTIDQLFGESGASAEGLPEEWVRKRWLIAPLIVGLDAVNTWLHPPNEGPPNPASSPG
jgi:hypothetical protein